MVGYLSGQISNVLVPKTSIFALSKMKFQLSDANAIIYETEIALIFLVTINDWFEMTLCLYQNLGKIIKKSILNKKKEKSSNLKK